MQKKIIALAVAGLASTAAFAQTNVSIYGIADAGVFYVNNSNGNSGVAVQSGVLGSSRLGFKGTEDLGNGVKAVFLLEQGFNIDDGNAPTAQASSSGGAAAFQRQAYVGLTSNAGSLTLGRQYAPGYMAGVRNDVFGGAVVSALSVLQVAAGTTIGINSNARWNNSIKYVSPNFAGFEGEVIYRAGEGQNDIASNEAFGLGLRYSAGPVNVEYVYQHADTSIQGTGTIWANASGGIEDASFLGGTFNAGFAKFFATAQVSDWGGRQLQQNARAEIYSLGVVVPVGKGNIHFNTAYLDLNGRNSASAGGSGTSHSLGYTYSLSKRTTLYTAVNYTDLASGTKTANLAGSTTLPAAITTVNNNTANVISGRGDGTTIGVGVNHAF